MRFFKTLISSVLIFNIFAVTIAPVIVSAATPKDAVCEGVGLGSGGTGCGTPAGSPDVNATIKTGLQIFAAIVGIIAVVMIIVGGLRYMMSGGDSGKTAAAQNTVLYAAIGLVVAAMAQVIAQFVLKRAVK